MTLTTAFMSLLAGAGSEREAGAAEKSLILFLVVVVVMPPNSMDGPDVLFEPLLAGDPKLMPTYIQTIKLTK